MGTLSCESGGRWARRAPPHVQLGCPLGDSVVRDARDEDGQAGVRSTPVSRQLGTNGRQKSGAGSGLPVLGGCALVDAVARRGQVSGIELSTVQRCRPPSAGWQVGQLGVAASNDASGFHAAQRRQVRTLVLRLPCVRELWLARFTPACGTLPGTRQAAAHVRPGNGTRCASGSGGLEVFGYGALAQARRSEPELRCVSHAAVADGLVDAV